MTKESLGRPLLDGGLAQGSERQIAVQAVADGPTGEAAGEQVDDVRRDA